LGLDPGGTTGFALYQAEVIRNPDGRLEWFNEGWQIGHMGPGEHHKTLYDSLGLWQTPNFIIVCESFEYRRNPRDSQRDNIVLDSKEYIGVVKLFEQERMQAHPGQRVVFQTAAMGKGFWTDDKLRKVGHYAVNMKHANDAMRHVLHYMVFKLDRKDLLELLK
jgi:hypothetical protein